MASFRGQEIFQMLWVVAFAVNIKNFIVIFHELWEQSSLQVKCDIKEIDCGFIGHNLQREAIALKIFCNFLFGLSTCIFPSGDTASQLSL